MAISRRSFLKLAGATGAATVAAPSTALAKNSSHDCPALLIDTTKCIGCRGCEVACSEANELPEPARVGDRSIFDQKRRTTPESFTVVNKVEKDHDGQKSKYVKKQCMHCLQPACASACPARALDKTPEGPVVYHKERCLGCRYCMTACPFEIPTFEYFSATPRIRKCEMCFSRQQNGEGPACASVCPSGALTFGKRGELLEEAKTRIYTQPDKYVHHVYGEDEVGGTSVLYLADASFEKLGFRTDLGEKGYPEYTEGALGLVPFIVTLWPPLLMGIYKFAQSRDEKSGHDTEHGEKTHE